MSEPAKPQRELQFRDYFRLLAKGRYIVLFSVAAFVGPTWWFVKHIPDYYITSSQLVLDKAQVNAPTMLMANDGQTERNIGFYRAIFQSQAFLDRVAQGAASELAHA